MMEESIPMIAFGAILLLACFMLAGGPGLWRASRLPKEDQDEVGLKL